MWDVCISVLSVSVSLYFLSSILFLNWLLSPPELDSCRCVVFSISTEQNENSALTGETVWFLVERRLSTRIATQQLANKHSHSEKLTRCWHWRFSYLEMIIICNDLYYFRVNRVSYLVDSLKSNNIL